MSAPYLLSSQQFTPFPDVETALTEPDGLLAIGGDLSSERLVEAYVSGIFPWYSPGQTILWWSPNPRAVLFPHKLRISRSLQKSLRKEPYRICFDTCFNTVINECAAPRKGSNDTWITPEMIDAYCMLHEAGIAHSVESWLDDKLVGGLYGLAIGKVFFGESMFSHQTDASKVAFVHLVEKLNMWGYELIDCQMRSDYLNKFGAEDIPRKDFIRLLKKYCTPPYVFSKWDSTSEKKV